MVTSSQASRNITMNIYEPLFGFSEDIRPIPILAESVEISEDGTSYRIPLREGVKFHNGDEMTAEDVKASLERYQEHGATQSMLEPIASIEVTGPLEVTLTLKEPTPTFLEAFASPRAPAVIIPEEEAAKAPNEISFIGTGPYKFVEYVPDSHVKLERFDEYSADTDHEGIDGFGGKKTAYLDTVTFRVIPEPGAAVAALETGEVHLLEQLPVPTARRLASNDDIEIYENMPWAFMTFIFNMKEAPSDNPKFREAVQIALNNEEIMAIATEGLFNLYHGWMYEGSTYDAGDVGKEYYNVADTERAKALLEEAGYNNEEFSILTDSTIPEHGKAGVVIGEQLKAIGINAVINQVDWPTALKIRLQDEGWNGWTLMMGIEPYLGPAALISALTGEAAHFRDSDEELDALYQELISTDSEEGRKAVFEKIQKRMYEFFGIIKVGETGLMQASRANVEGFKPFRFPRVYDVWLEQN
ncbi:ABC transporter substrate-binding protein [Pseudohoeflea sp. DP4N28-3]|uniref:ABC transporter substrate-binding protein n=2 Tax=Pseudohoeflea coraliihabitans TaxID=2860393 RepID=A0ABS6WIC8_9HYPH|nr:ABC transporter substrate-binding protein [Pseudohoeflea sp. DP4N28-3]